MRNNYIIGSFEVAIANFFVGFNIISNKYLVNTVPVSVLLELRYFFGVLILLGMLFFSKKGFQFYTTAQQYTSKEKGIYLLMALSGGSIFNAIYMIGIHDTTAIATGMISSAIPVLIVLFSFLFLRQKLNRNHFISAILVTFGICIVNFGYSGVQTSAPFTNKMLQGNLIVFLAMISEALFTIFAKMLTTKVSPIMSALMINAINLLFCTPFFLFSLRTYSLNKLTGLDLGLSFLIGLFSGALFYSFYNSGISKINAQTAGLLTGIVPISTTILSMIFLHETFGLVTFIGMCFVLTSIYVGVRVTSGSGRVLP